MIVRRVMLASAVLGSLAVGCSFLVNLDELGGLDGDGGPLSDVVQDAPKQDAVASDASTICAWDSPFTSVHAVAGIPTAKSAVPYLSRDELIIYYQLLDAPDGGQQQYNLVQAVRSDRNSTFGPPVPLTSINQVGANSTNASVSTDGLLAVFASNRQRLPASETDLFLTHRASTLAAFDPPSLITQLGVTDPTGSPFLTSDGKELWFSVASDAGARTTYLAPVLDGGLQVATPRPDVPGWFATLSDDKRTLYFSSGGSTTTAAIRVAHRSGVLDAFPAASLVNEVNQSGELPSWLSPDQCRLYFTTRRNTGVDIYVAERVP